MKSSPPHDQQEIIEVKQGIFNLLKKANFLLEEAQEYENKQVIRDENWEEFIKKMQFNNKIIKNQIGSCVYELSSGLKQMERLIQKLRVTATEDDFLKVQRKSDNWPVAEYLTKKSFENMLNFSLKEHNLFIKD